MVIGRSAAATATEAVFEVADPELPHVSIGDLGIVRKVEINAETGVLTAALTPTYTGCPATEQIRDDVATTIRQHGFEPHIEIIMSPPWSTDWITDRGRERLRAAGIAPPNPVPDATATAVELPVACPRCGSRRTRRITEFGSTACKASYVCNICREPFDYFKPH